MLVLVCTLKGENKRAFLIMDPNVEITLLTYGSKTIDCFLGHVQ